MADTEPSIGEAHQAGHLPGFPAKPPRRRPGDSSFFFLTIKSTMDGSGRVFEKSPDGRNRWFSMKMSSASKLMDQSAGKSDFDLSYEIEKNINMQV